MSDALTIDISLEDGRATLRLGGTLDATTVSSLVEVLAHVDGRFGTVVLDLGQLEGLDLSAAHTVTLLRDELGVRFQRLELANANGTPAHVLEMADVEAGTPAE